MNRKAVLPFIIILSLLLSGCTDISDRGTDDNAADVEALDGIGADLLITDENDGFVSYSFSPAQESFISSCVFMGDIICRGLSDYGLTESCYADENVSAENIAGFEFDGVSSLAALVNSGSKRFVFLFGANDLNNISAEEYAEYYGSFLSKAEAACPEAAVYVVSLPPAPSGSDNYSSEDVASFNAALKELTEGSAVRHYVDLTPYLSDSSGCLDPIYSGEGGLQLTMAGYYALLYALCA